MGEGMRRYRSLMMDSGRWEGFEFRDDDIVISTPPKCGTTWTQMICALLIFQTPDLPAKLTELSPWVDVQTRSVDKVFAALDAQTHRRFIKSHTPYDGLPHDPRVTYLCVGRDPRDVAISWDNHFNNMNMENIFNARAEAVGLDDVAEFMAGGLPEFDPDPVSRFWQWVEDDTDLEQGMTGLKATLNHLQTFWDHRNDPNIVLLHYADLQADLDGEMRRVADRLHVEIDRDRWSRLVEAARFEQMKGKAELLAPQVTDGFWTENDGFFKSGATGQWRALVTDADMARYEARVRELASPDLAEWAHHGFRGAARTSR